MHVKWSHWVWLALVVSVLACKPEPIVSGPECGDGTRQEESGECVAVINCGAGTVEKDGQCVREVVCSTGTVEQDGECLIADRGPECAAGTHEADGACVADAEITCGPEAELLGQECVPIERVCGDETRREGDSCVPDPRCGEGAVQVGDQCLSDWVVEPTPLEGCAVVAREVCSHITSCCDPLTSIDAAAELDGSPFLRDPVTCRTLLEWNCVQHFSTQFLAIAVGDAEPREDAIDVIRGFYQVDSCTVPIQMSPVTARMDRALPLLVEQQAIGESCYGQNDWCEGSWSCISSELTGPVCTIRSTQGNPCDESDSADCQDDDGAGNRLYCDSDRVCKPYAALEASCETRACDPTEAFCGDGTCQALKVLGDACAAEAECGEAAWCRPIDGEPGSECAAFRPSGEACDELNRCDPALECNSEDVCASRIGICDVEGEFLL